MKVYPSRHAGAEKQRVADALPLEIFLKELDPTRPKRVAGTAIYMTAQVANVPTALLHNMKHNRILHERNVIMGVEVLDPPRIAEAERLEVRHTIRIFTPSRCVTALSKSPIYRVCSPCCGLTDYIAI